MSLLVFGSASRVANAIIRAAQESGKYSEIVCADLYPNYAAFQRFFHFQDSLHQNHTKLKHLKITDKSDLDHAIKSSAQVVYITHDYYKNVPTKEGLLRNTLAISKLYNKPVVSVLPIELDHFGEANPYAVIQQQEPVWRDLLSQTVLVRSDVTFGESSFVSEATRILKGRSVLIQQNTLHVPQPILAQNLAQSVLKLSADFAQFKGQSFLAFGKKALKWEQYLDLVANQKNSQTSKYPFEGIPFASSIQNNFISEVIYSDKYRNLVQLIQNYRSVVKSDDGTAKSIETLGVTLTDVEEFYANGKNTQSFNEIDQCYFHTH